MSWWNGLAALEPLWHALGESDMELDRRAEQKAVVGTGQCLSCNKFADEINALQGQIQIYETQAGISQQVIDGLREQLKAQHNEHLRMDRGIYRADGFPAIGE